MSTTTVPRQITSVYRQILRELPIRQRTATSSINSSSGAKPTRLSSPSLLQQRIREQLSTEKHTSPSQLAQAEQFVKYMQAQRQYITLVERYNPGMGMSEEERVRLTARRVGMDLPKEFGKN